MRITQLLLLLSFYGLPSMAGALASNQESKFTFDTLKPPATLEEKLKNKALESVRIRNYVNSLSFKAELNKNSDISRIFPSSGSAKSRLTENEALSSYDEFLFSSRQLGDRKKESDALKAYGNFYALNGDLDKSISFYREALFIKEELKDKPEIMRTNYRLAAISKYKGQYEEAIQFYEKAISTAMSIRSSAIVPQSYLEMALIRAAQVKNGEAEYLVLRKALPLFTRQGNREGRINSFQALASIYHQQNRYSEAKWFYIQANTLARKINDKNNVVSSLINLGKIKFALGQYPLALKDYKEAEILAAKNKDLAQLAEVKGGLGDLYYKMGNRIAASKALDEYLKLKTSLFGSPDAPLALK